jgi:hypothetical protein
VSVELDSFDVVVPVESLPADVPVSCVRVDRVTSVWVMLERVALDRVTSVAVVPLHVVVADKLLVASDAVTASVAVPRVPVPVVPVMPVESVGCVASSTLLTSSLISVTMSDVCVDAVGLPVRECTWLPVTVLVNAERGDPFPADAAETARPPIAGDAAMAHACVHATVALTRAAMRSFAPTAAASSLTSTVSTNAASRDSIVRMYVARTTSAAAAGGGGSRAMGSRRPGRTVARKSSMSPGSISGACWLHDIASRTSVISARSLRMR